MNTIHIGMFRLFGALALAGAVGVAPTGVADPAMASPLQSAAAVTESQSHGDLEAAILTVTSGYPADTSPSDPLLPDSADPLEWCITQGVDACSDIRNYLASKPRPTPWDQDRHADLIALFQNHAFEDETDDELQKSSLVPTCPPGTVFVEAYQYRVSSFGIPLKGACKVIGSPDRPGSVPLWEDDELEEFSEQASPEDLPEQVVHAFDIAPECFATLGLDPEGREAVTMQYCPEDAIEGSTLDTSRSIPRYVVPVPSDFPVLLHLCVLTHPAEVSGSADACDEPANAGEANISTASLLTAASPGELVDGDGLVALNGTILDTELEVQDGHAHVALPALGLGVHHVQVEFTAAGLTTSVEVLIDAQNLSTSESVPEGDFLADSGEPPEPSEGDAAVNSPVLLYSLTGLFSIALLITVWMLVSAKVVGRRY